MNRERRKGFISGIVTAFLVISLVGVAGAAVGQKVLKADYSNIKVSVNGTTIHPTTASGAYVEPFAVDGTTYLPVRAVSNAVGYDVDWDQSTKTVILSNSSDASDLTTDQLNAMEYCACLMQLTDRLHIYSVSMVDQYPSVLDTKDKLYNLLYDYIYDLLIYANNLSDSFDSSSPYWGDLLIAGDSYRAQYEYVSKMIDCVETNPNLMKSYFSNETTCWTQTVSDIKYAMNAIQTKK